MTPRMRALVRLIAEVFPGTLLWLEKERRWVRMVPTP